MAIRGISPRAAKTLGLTLSLGWRIAGGVVLGYFLDQWLETAPIFITVCAIGGLYGAIRDIIRASKTPMPGEGTGEDRGGSRNGDA